MSPQIESQPLELSSDVTRPLHSKPAVDLEPAQTAFRIPGTYSLSNGAVLMPLSVLHTLGS